MGCANWQAKSLTVLLHVNRALFEETSLIIHHSEQEGNVKSDYVNQSLRCKGTDAQIYAKRQL